MAAGQRNIKSRRKLSDLYRKGVEVRFGPGDKGPEGHVAPSGEGLFEEPLPSDEWIQVWVTPPHPLQREMALRDAQAAKARALVRAKRNEDSEEHLTIQAFLADMSQETMIDYVLIQDMDARQQEAMRDVLADPKWEDITSYQDAMRQFDEQNTPTDDPEFAAMLKLDEEFGEQVLERLQELTQAGREALALRSRSYLEKRALDKRAEIVGNQAFMHEYETQMLFYSVRDFDNQDELFYENATECASADADILEKIREAMLPFIAEGGEAKNLLGVADGSEPSEPPSEQETSEASTPEGVSA